MRSFQIAIPFKAHIVGMYAAILPSHAGYWSVRADINEITVNGFAPDDANQEEVTFIVALIGASIEGDPVGIAWINAIFESRAVYVKGKGTDE